eukprot:Partr_v1_DN27869_c1_g1_i1_m22500 putative ecotropic viral integration site
MGGIHTETERYRILRVTGEMTHTTQTKYLLKRGMEPLESPQSENRDVLAGYFGSSGASSPASPISPSPQSPPPPASSSAAAAVVQNDDDQVLIPSDSLKDVKPATFKGPPSRVKSKFSSPSSTTPVSGGDPVVSTDRRRSSVSSAAGSVSAAAGDDKVSIVHSLVELKPTFSLDTVVSSTSALDDRNDDALDIEAEPLSQAEIDLLVRLERQNSELSQKQQSQAQILPVLSIPTSRTTYFRDVFSSASGSPVKESFVGASPLVDHLSLGPAAAASASVAPVKAGGDGGDVEADWEFWGRLLNEFESTLKKQHKVLIKKIHAGLPRALRGTLWYNFSRLHPVSFLRGLVGGLESNNNDSHVSVLSNSSSLVSPPIGAVGAFRFLPPDAFRTASLEDAYVELLKLSSPYEKMIIRDLSRTFPKHEFFKHADGSGQESLFHVMKAYSLYDPEVGYCQGLSFIVGALLLNMPDEQAFACLVHLMHTYNLRNCFTPRMEQLQLRLYQFDRIVQETLPRLNEHLLNEGVRSTMYASQWFLTIFSYRFPLDFVFRIFDIIFACGVLPNVSGSEGGMMDAMMEKMSESVAAVSGSAVPKTQEVGTEVAIVLFRFAICLLKKNEEMILALEFEPLLEFLKHGLFEIYIGQSEQHTANGHAYEGEFKLDGNSDPTSSPSTERIVSKQAIDEIVKDAMSTQWKSLTKKRMHTLAREYEEELKKSDPVYLAEKSLEAQNQRLINDLKRAEKMLAELNRDHCDLAGQLISVRIDLAKEREVQEALRRQVSDLKHVLEVDVKRFDRLELDRLVQHEVTLENAETPLPTAVPAPLSDQDRMPSLEEQVVILERQSLMLVEEAQDWKAKFEAKEREFNDLKQTYSTSTSSSSGQHPPSQLPQQEGVSGWTKRFFSSPQQSTLAAKSPDATISMISSTSGN